MADHPHPVALLQGADNLGTDRNATNVFDFPARDGLAVGDERQSLEQRPRVTRRFFIPQARHPRGNLGAHLDAIATGHLHHLDATPGIVLLQSAQRREHGLARRLFVLAIECQQPLDTERAASGQQGTLNNLFKIGFRRAFATRLRPRLGVKRGIVPRRKLAIRLDIRFHFRHGPLHAAPGSSAASRART